MKQSKFSAFLIFLAAGGTGCDSGAEGRTGTLPWSEGKVQVVGADGAVTDVAIPQGDQCLVVDVGEEFADPKNCAKP